MDAIFIFTVTQEQHQKYLLDCLLPSIPYLNSDQWNELMVNGNLKVDGLVTLENSILLENQKVEYIIPNYEEGEVDTSWKLLWQNHQISAVHKPANLPVSRTTRNVYNTLIQLLRRESPWPDAHLLHRLDLETSGIILIGQTKADASLYQPKISKLIHRKIYHAVVHGKPDWNELDYECDLNTLKDSAIRCQMHKVEKGKTSRTLFQVLKTDGEFSLIQCELLTGRKHQIRAHLSSLGHAIVGDKIYSNDGDFYLKRLEDNLTDFDHERLLTKQHLLHAYQVHLVLDGDTDSTKPIVITDDDYSSEWTQFMAKKPMQSLP